MHEYQREFERLGNRVQGWTQKALVSTYIGGLKAEIADGIRMFEPKSLKEAISLARMPDEHLNRLETATRPFSRTIVGSSPMKMKTLSPMKRLTWAEMQRRRAQGLCFNCNEKFAPWHKCKEPQLLLLEGNYDKEENDEAGAHSHL